MRSPLSQLKEMVPSRRRLGRSWRRLERVSVRHARRYLNLRLAHFREVQRHVGGWLLGVVLLSLAAFWQSTAAAQQYSTSVPVERGAYSEGVSGIVETLNPIFASTPAERSAARLLFASLLRYDDKNDLVGELADQWGVDDDGKTYVVHIRPEAKWQDGQPITADDVLFTFLAIKNIDTKSPLYSSWRNVGISKVDAQTVKFTLPAPYAAFTDSLTVGILPQHILKDKRANELRTMPYNLAPDVVSGPFTFTSLTAQDLKRENNLLLLAANPNYVLGAPKLKGFQLHAYKNRDDLTQAFRSQVVAGFSDTVIHKLEVLGDPDNFTYTDNSLFNGVYAFLNMQSPILKDGQVRQALAVGTDRSDVVKLFDGRVRALDGPLLPEQIGYSSDIRQPNHDYVKAGKLLDEAGWKVGSDGIRSKDGQPLKLNLVTVSEGDYSAVAQELTDTWSKLGIAFDSQAVRAEDLQQNYIAGRGYDILLYEIAIGRDPDVYAYWHSSQTSERGLNLSNYKSEKVDDALESARTIMDPQLRAAKYRFFMQQWVNDTPAIGLYRPSLEYVQNRNVITFAERPLADPISRYFNVRYWAAGRQEGMVTR